MIRDLSLCVAWLDYRNLAGRLGAHQPSASVLLPVKGDQTRVRAVMHILDGYRSHMFFGYGSPASLLFTSPVDVRADSPF